MPCRDSESYQPMSIRGIPTDNPAHLRKIAFLEAALCMVMRAVHNAHPDTGVVFDYEEAGVPRKELELWWKSHQEKDRVRREADARRKKRKARRQKALDKLTPREKKLLGLKDD